MNYPNVALRIDNYLPSVELYSDVETQRTMTAADRSIDTVLKDVASAMGADWSTEEVFRRAYEGDEFFVEFPALTFETEIIDFKPLEKIALEAVSEFAIPEGLSEELHLELTNNMRSDVLASLLDEIYTMLIARTVFLASEVAVGEISLIDDRADARLREKMARNLEEIDLELTVPELATFNYGAID